MSDHQKSKSKNDYCEVIDIDGTKHELIDHSEIAGHISAVFRKIFDNNFPSDIEGFLEFLGDDKEKIGIIDIENTNRFKEDITITEMKQ